MNVLATLCAAGLVAGGVVVCGQAIPEPRRGSGAGVTGAYEGWYYNEDGSRSFLVGYYNRNTLQEPDIPVGPNNRIESDPSAPAAGPDMGQPTHFLPGRQWGMFAVPVPKDFKPTDAYRWTLVVNGQSATIPLRLHPDYVMSPFSEIAVHNTPPILRFEQNGKPIQGPIAMIAATAAPRTATVGTPLALPAWITDDMKYTSGTSAPVSASRQPVTLRWSKYRGPGAVTFDKARPEIEKLSAGEGAFSGRSTTTARFSEAGDYVLHVTVNDFSGDGGGGFGCCWTTGLLRVSVK